ncbi:MAG: DUF512 domain-containing protein [Clostridia bacterium]|nr:DUF512 domain-containing protein [Clostridia bacterium]
MLEIIARGKLAKRFKLNMGDKILAFDGYPAEDELDYIYYDSKSSFKMLVADKGGTKREVEITKPEDESLGLVLKKNEKIRTCHNKCMFCFVDQMGKGMRESLYVKDDDYVLSFMCGNFVTLTNVSDEELERIIRLHLSPLYISVHTMDGDLRCKIMGNRFAGKIGEQLKKLTDAGIIIHCQAVIVTGLNDGENLEYTARQLFQMYPYINDLAVVPTGLTKFRAGLAEIRDFTAEEGKAIIELCDRLNGEFGVNFLLPADEYFIRSGENLKPVDFYGDFSQIENGIGMTSKFIAEVKESFYKATLKKQRRVAVITGVSAHKTIQSLCGEANALAENLKSFALPVENNFFGKTVTCTGLLTGVDIASALEKVYNEFDCAIIPSNTMKEFEDVFLDNMTLKELKARLKGKKIIVNRKAETFFENLIKG